MPPKSTFDVAITGNAPFMAYGFNTSLMVRDALPEVIKRPGQKDIRIWKYSRVTRDTFSDVRRVSQDIWGGRRDLFLPVPQPSEKEEIIDIDVILHFGMVAFGWPESFRFETVARRDGYEKPGDDGQYVDSAALQRLGLPKTLNTCFDIEAAWRGVKEKFPDATTVVSNDAGQYFCEFRLYSSLSEPLLTSSLRKKAGRVVFQHLPQAHAPKDIALAREISITFISGLADDKIGQDEEVVT
ncbi:hypothetical protein DL98DRAFT_570964 [Cadophora sp. DSE1049]|nr:hypothetical protein DL98DRAFT_570964 [Cadophora sp. DSE1049]